MTDNFSALRSPTLEEIESAKKNIKGKAVRTPLVKLQGVCLSPGAPEIYLKLENIQPTGAFKVRPAANAISCIDDKESLKKNGVWTASAGNFAQGLAWCCQDMGITCTVITPDHAPEVKLNAIQGWGATVIKVPYAVWWEAIETCTCPKAPEGATFIHPGCEQSVLAGNATIALEIVEDLPDVDCIITPWGSGALTTGIACGIRQLSQLQHMKHLTNCEVVAVEPDSAAPFTLSKREGKPVRFTNYKPSFVDGCGGKSVLDQMWSLANDVVASGVCVSVDQVASAIRHLAVGNKIVAEGAGACPVAAAINGLCGPKPSKVVCVVSGGGLDPKHLQEILAGKTPQTVVKKDESPDSRLGKLGIDLPTAPEPKGNYVPGVVTGNMFFTAGHGPVLPDGNFMQGVLGTEVVLEEAVHAARLTGLAMLSTIRHTLGSLDRVKRVVKVLGMVNADPAIINNLECVHVINGFSDLMVEVFGPEHGVGARSAVGMATLPMNTTVEIEAIFELHDVDI